MISVREKNFASIVVYCWNNENLVEEFLTRIAGHFSSSFEHFEIILVDDCSMDGSPETALRVASTLEGATVTVVNLSYPQGKETALAAGIDLSIGDFVFEFETLGIDYPDQTLSEVYEECLKGHDIVAAAPDGPPRLANRVFFSLFNRGRGPLIPIGTESFRILSRRAINRIGMVSGKVVYRKAVYYGCGLKTKTIRYRPLPGVRRLPPRSISEEATLAIDSLLYFTNLGFRAALLLSFAMMLFSIMGVVYAITVYLVRNHLVEGWLTTMLFLSFGFLGLFSILAIVIKYLSLILTSTHQKQPYVYESVIKANQNG
jgi:dolichol-phosphate mannosyltransferase